jgi:SulP family sulfate permease
MIPMATLAGILVYVAYNMSEWENFISVAKGPKSDVAVLLTTFLLTVLIDLTVAIEIGMLLAAFLFVRKMIQYTDVAILTRQDEDRETRGEAEDPLSIFYIPPHVEVFEITGPLFFGAAYKFKDAIKSIERPPKVLIIRMGQVPIIDATGTRTIQEVYKESRRRGTRIILSEVSSLQVREELRNSRLLFAIGKANVTFTFEQALQRCNSILADPGPLGFTVAEA